MGGGRLLNEPPWLVPETQPLELIFYRKAFAQLQEYSDREDDNGGVQLLVFQRAVSRLYLLLQDHREFDAKHYDINGDGTVGWWEFCLLWKDEKLAVHLSLAERIHLTLEDPQASRLGRVTSIFILCAIFVSALSFILSTLPMMEEQLCDICEPEPFAEFAWIDTACVVIFTIEYLVRLVVAAYSRLELTNQDETINKICAEHTIMWPTKFQRAISFVTAWPNLIDLAAICPSYIAWFVESKGDSEDGSSSGTMVVLKLIRLMRVVRAFRLGRRFEAVIIIGRSIARSVRALWVLVLNISLGTLIFGAIIFFLEQGDYDPASGQYLRPNGWWEKVYLENGTYYYQETVEKSPFESIPHSFWWALVTATTVGYGDVVPTSVGGKLCAGVAMVWSLCVLALPVGVIGANFENVWMEYDTEKQLERQLRESEREMVRQTLGSLDPLSLSRRLLLEVYHDSCLSTKDKENDTFIGEVEVDLEIEPDTLDPVHKQLKLPLRENRLKTDRKVSGDIFFSYTWVPQKPDLADTLVEGLLTVTILRAEKLAPVDWKNTELADPYVVVTAYPESPDAYGVVIPQVQRISTVFDEVEPVWQEHVGFSFCWSLDGVQAKKEADRRGRAMGTSESMSEDDRRIYADPIPRLQGDVAQLRRVLPVIQTEVDAIRSGTQAILAHLGIVVPPEVPSMPAEGVPRCLENVAEVPEGPRAAEAEDAIREAEDPGGASNTSEVLPSPDEQLRAPADDVEESQHFAFPGAVPRSPSPSR
mmetsp:Transcript_26681/g.58657  ORF Transcript_26681/g.58657 Transcript_26681/m.58657 type:complete len:760 (-) Transcript_26681:89-2368(-)